ncbi:MAG: hypothetical protein Q4C64_05165 [Erysipelotrichia bacterium]|nr:hypothetical protein [Erysipelotrichia bacterium]
MKKKNKSEKGWKIFNSDIKTWNNMMLYYKWCACIFCLLFAAVLFYEKIWILGVAVFVFAWYVIPLKYIRDYDCYLGKGGKKLILYANIVLTIIGIYSVIKSM